MSVCLFCSQCWSSAEAKKLALLVRALNFNVGLQQYTVAYITTLENISDVCSALSIDETLVQTGVCGFRKKTIGVLSMCELRIVCEIHAIISMKTGLCLKHIGKSQAPKSLDNEACGLVLLRCGGERQLNDRASNLFVYDGDQPCLDKGTGKVVNTRQSLPPKADWAIHQLRWLDFGWTQWHRYATLLYLACTDINTIMEVWKALSSKRSKVSVFIEIHGLLTWQWKHCSAFWPFTAITHPFLPVPPPPNVSYKDITSPCNQNKLHAWWWFSASFC